MYTFYELRLATEVGMGEIWEAAQRNRNKGFISMDLLIEASTLKGSRLNACENHEIDEPLFTYYTAVITSTPTCSLKFCTQDVYVDPIIISSQESKERLYRPKSGCRSRGRNMTTSCSVSTKCDSCFKILTIRAF